jgi:DNA polymerase-3 subunit gamma/tau
MSEPYIVSARKYRPATFRSVVGQRNLTSTLKGAIDSGRLAHAYLFCGPRGVGKTSCARIFAKTINCLSPTADGEACGECESCKAIDKGNSFNLSELDAASNNSVDDIRQITEQVNVPPQVGKYRVFIIDEVHMLTQAAFNAFLKTLEEPPSYAVFILATTEKHKVLPTILSRCQIYDFKRITLADIVDHLAYVAESEGITAERKALGVIARKADGAMRDALSIFDQVAASCAGNITYDAVVRNLNVLDYDYFFKLVETFAKADAPGALLLYKEIRDRGFDSLFFINSLAQHIRDLMVAADPRTLPLLETPDDIGEQLVQQARMLQPKWYYAAMKLLNDCDLQYRTSSSKQLLVELTLIRLSQLNNPDSPFDKSDRKVALRDPSDPYRATLPDAAPRTAQPQPAAHTQPPVQTQPEAQPQPVAQPRPATQPRPSVQPQAPVQSAAISARRPRSFQLGGASAQASSSLERLNESFSDDQFMQAWHEYIRCNPHQQILTSAMTSATPRRRTDQEFSVLVDHPAQVQAFESAMPTLLKFLREHLRNDFLTLKAEINPDKKIAKFLPPQEFLRKVVTDNAALGEFLKQLDIEIC